ncbi:hypothetical protein RHSIM_Rhsim11G0133600 [Rhododendron simsii]|uniref:Uncharacterized protein n=1 Tax=Rhododendron simsii TaxID=118357 RepID=A0A834G648_RHOSS|nr:hypothetical protein RHSIM_Rhsim11G0133600 [Rhododendron simsii]
MGPPEGGGAGRRRRVENMSEELEYRCFIGGLSWSTSDRGLKAAFDKFGHLVEAKFLGLSVANDSSKESKLSNNLPLFSVTSKGFSPLDLGKARCAVAVDKFSGRSRGFGFVTFDEKNAMEDAIEEMNGMELDGRTITVEKAQPNQGSGRDRDGNRPRDRDRGRDHGRDRDYGGGGGRGSGGGECFKCGKPGHFARECPGEGGRGMVTVQGDVVGILVVGEGIDIVATVLAHMTAVDEMTPQNYAEELEERKN